MESRLQICTRNMETVTDVSVAQGLAWPIPASSPPSRHLQASGTLSCSLVHPEALLEEEGRWLHALESPEGQSCVGGAKG